LFAELPRLVFAAEHAFCLFELLDLFAELLRLRAGVCRALRISFTAAATGER
jgi:hypothetical protein